MTDGGSRSEAWLKARIAWMHFVGGVNQNQIAATYGMSRATVSRIITRARNDGTVKIQLTVPLNDCLDLADRLQTRFGLNMAIVIPTAPDYADLQRSIGETAGDYLDGLIRDSGGLALGWGRTLSFAVNRLTVSMGPDYDVVGLMGSRPYGSTSNPFEVISTAAQRTGGTGHYMTVPILVEDPALRRMLLGHQEVGHVLSLAARSDVALVACGDLSERNLMMSIASVREAAEALREAGAVGDLLGTFLDGDGNPVDHPINEQIVAAPLANLREKSATILAAGGENKVPIIRSLLKGRYIDHLVTDEATATRLIA